MSRDNVYFYIFFITTVSMQLKLITLTGELAVSMKDKPVVSTLIDTTALFLFGIVLPFGLFKVSQRNSLITSQDNFQKQIACCILLQGISFGFIYSFPYHFPQRSSFSFCYTPRLSVIQVYLQKCELGSNFQGVTDSAGCKGWHELCTELSQKQFKSSEQGSAKLSIFPFSLLAFG